MHICLKNMVKQPEPPHSLPRHLNPMYITWADVVFSDTTSAQYEMMMEALNDGRCIEAVGFHNGYKVRFKAENYMGRHYPDVDEPRVEGKVDLSFRLRVFGFEFLD